MPVDLESDSQASVASLKQYLWSIVYMPSSLRYIHYLMPGALSYNSGTLTHCLRYLHC